MNGIGLLRKTPASERQTNPCKRVQNIVIFQLEYKGKIEIISHKG